jgi:cell wall-associated NlpC family hydrolase
MKCIPPTLLLTLAITWLSTAHAEPDDPAITAKPETAAAEESVGDTKGPRPARTKRTTSEAETAPPLSDNLAQDIMLQALGLIGVTYRYGGNSPETGLDCSGFIRYVFKHALNIALPHNAFAISRLGEEIEKEELKPGDLVFFNTLGRKFSHVGIYLGDDRFVHAPSSGGKIQIVRMTDAYWAKRYNGARRVTHDSVAERSPMLASLMAEAQAAGQPGKSKKKSAKPKQGAKKIHKKRR